MDNATHNLYSRNMIPGRIRPNLAFACLLLGLACSPPMAGPSADTTPVPTDFKLSARYSPGYSNWKPWSAVITADGKVWQDIQLSRNGKDRPIQKPFLLTTNDLQQLVAVARASQFEKLKTNYSYPVTDMPELTLELTLEGGSHKVVVYAPDILMENQDVKKDVKKEVIRFLRLWNELLKKVPSPNPEQQPQ
jgi:hypothetical protein